MFLGTSNGVGAKGAAGKHKNRTDMVDTGAPPTNHENLLALLQLLHTLPLWFAFVLLCFARLVFIVSLLSGFRSGVRSSPRLGLSSGCCELLQHRILIWYLASTSNQLCASCFTSNPASVLCFDIESGFHILRRHRIQILHFTSTSNPVFALRG